MIPANQIPNDFDANVCPPIPSEMTIAYANGRYLYEHQTKADYGEAQCICEALSMEMADITTQELYEEVVRHSSKYKMASLGQ